MRTFIRISPTKHHNSGRSGGTRYMSERERNVEREGTATRQLFTADREGLGRHAANTHLAGDGGRDEGGEVRAKDLHHFVFLFGHSDARELERVSETGYQRALTTAAERKLEGRQRDRFLRVERDRAYMQAVRGTMSRFADKLGAKDTRWTAVVHRHTTHPHVHLLLHKDYTDRESGEGRRLDRVPKEFLNGRDEHGRAKGGELDRYLSEALDTVIPQRQREQRTQSQPSARDGLTHARGEDVKGRRPDRPAEAQPARGTRAARDHQEPRRRDDRDAATTRATRGRAETNERDASPAGGRAGQTSADARGHQAQAAPVSVRSLGADRRTIFPTPQSRADVPRNDRLVSPHLGRADSAASPKRGRDEQPPSPARPDAPLGTRAESLRLRPDAGRNETGRHQQVPHALRDLTRAADQSRRQPERRRAGKAFQRAR